MSRDQNAGRIHSVRTDNSTFDRVEDFKYLGTILTNQNSIAEKIKSRLKSEAVSSFVHFLQPCSGHMQYFANIYYTGPAKG